MCVASHFPSPGGSAITGLSAGDEVVVKGGFGHPAAEKDVVEIIASVDGLSALTNTGRMLACSDGHGVEPTGKHFDDFKLSPEAMQLMEEASAREEG